MQRLAQQSIVMPGHKQHCEDCERKLGKRFPEVHAWLDALYDGDGSFDHRAAKHHLEGVEEVRKLWGDDAARAAILHILLDWEGIKEDEIPKNHQEAEAFPNRWFSNLPRLDELHNASG